LERNEDLVLLAGRELNDKTVGQIMMEHAARAGLLETSTGLSAGRSFVESFNHHTGTSQVRTDNASLVSFLNEYSYDEFLKVGSMAQVNSRNYSGNHSLSETGGMNNDR
jgi:hypothetical protein